MSPKRHSVRVGNGSLVVAVLCAIVLAPGDTLAFVASPSAVRQSQTGDQSPAISPDQLDSLVAPIALYPDPLLAQVLAASTYPLEIIQLQQWLGKNQGVKDKALADAVQKEPWDPSVQSLAALPDVVKWLADDIQWTTDLGNAFLAQESDVMEAVQRMRKKAKDAGKLKSSEQQVVETKVVENKSVIVIEQSNPQVVYVPSYNPAVVWGAPIYPYPPIYYPPPGYYAAGMAISFGVGVAMGAWWGGGGGWGCGWGRNNLTINNNNNFIRNSNIRNGNIGGNGGNRWQHRPEHRGGAPYRDRGTADRFGGTTRGDSLANRQGNARQQVGRQGGNLPSNRAGGAGVSDRASGGAGNRAGGAGTSNRAAAPGGASNRANGAGAGNRAGGGGADRVGSRDLSRSGGGGSGAGGNRNAFGGGSQGFNGSSARASGNRGASSMGSRGGGGGASRGGGGGRRGGGRRG